MVYNEAYLVPNPMGPNACVLFDPEVCIGCNTCVDQCRSQVLLPNPVEGKPPIVAYPDDCWFCGCCVNACPVPGANSMEHPLQNKVAWKRKETGEFFRIGMKNPPPPNLKPPVDK